MNYPSFERYRVRRLGAILIVLSAASITLKSQVDSSRLEFFPLESGDTLLYVFGSYPDGVPAGTKYQVTYGDTVLSNGLRYSRQEGNPVMWGEYYRIDSLLRIQTYIPPNIDSFGGGWQNEVSFFRLDEADSSYWRVFSDCAGQLWSEPYYMRYEGIQRIEEFGDSVDLMIFHAGGKTLMGDPTFWGWGPYITFLRGFGIYFSRYGESDWTQLMGAVIKGVRYGWMATGVHDGTPHGPEKFSLRQNYPNPFNPSTDIHYTLPARNLVLLTVYDLLGRHVKILVDSFEEAGEKQVRFDGSGLASGVYFYRLQSGKFVETKKMVLMR